MDMDEAAGLHVQSVAVLGVVGILDRHIADGQVLTEIRVHVPCGGVLQAHSLDQNIAAVPQTDHNGPVEIVVRRGGCQRALEGGVVTGEDLPCDSRVEYTLGGEPYAAFFGVNNKGRLFEQSLPLPFGHLELFHRAPEMSVSVDDAASCDGDIFRVFGIDGRPGADPCDPFKVCYDQRVFLRIFVK